jgi:hypothetical protein
MGLWFIQYKPLEVRFLIISAAVNNYFDCKEALERIHSAFCNESRSASFASSCLRSLYRSVR